MQVGPAISLPIYRVFLSSGDDARDLRDRVDRLVTEAVNSQLMHVGINLRLEVDRWERTAATNNPNESTNDQFVKRALNSNLTLALFRRKVGQGTREEIEATLAADKSVSVLWFVPRKSKPKSEVATFLEPLADRLYYDKTGRPDEDESWHGIIKVLFRLTLEGLKQHPKGLYFEER